MFFCGVHCVQNSKHISHFYKTIQDLYASKLCRGCTFHETCESSGILISINRTQPDRRTRCLLSCVGCPFPVSCIISPDMTTCIMSCITSSHSPEYRPIRCCICTYCTTTRNTGCMAVTDGRNKRLTQTQQPIYIQQMRQQSASGLI